ncbi:MAG: divalent-cation tolerance protein CutA [Alphaproteobacteria bacterium]
MQVILIYVTIGNILDAEKLSRQLVEDKLVACANIYPGIRAIYEWDGKMMHDEEVSIILKTRAELWEKVRERIVELHPYDCPAILALPVQDVHQPYLQWIHDKTP